MEKTNRTHADIVNEVASDFSGGPESLDIALPTPDRVKKSKGIQRIPVKIKKLSHYGDLPDLKIATIGSSGVDLFAALDDDVCLNNMGARALIPTGIAIALPLGFEAQIRPRSGLAAKEGLTVLNTPGTIDSDYRGEIKIILINLSTKKFFVKHGMRIAQMVVKPVWMPEIEYVETLDDTKRGEGGFGSSGK